MQSKLGHVVFGVRAENMPFYKDMLSFLGWRTVYDVPEMLGVVDSNGTSLWFGTDVKDLQNDYDGPGMNHFALHVESQAHVDSAAGYLAERGLALLFDTPRHRAEFSHSDEHTYYQIMFETPDRILVEIVYIGPKAA